jgi:hypothetical protein
MTPQLKSYCQAYLKLICSKEKGLTTSFAELKSLYSSTNPYQKEEILDVLKRNGYINLYHSMASATNEGIAFCKNLS